MTRTNSEDDAEDDNVRLVFSHSVEESFGNHDDQVDHDYEECVAEVSLKDNHMTTPWVERALKSGPVRKIVVRLASDQVHLAIFASRLTGGG